MGVTGLTRFVYENKRFVLADYELRDTRLVIDGHNFCYHLYYQYRIKQNYGGDYDRFADVCEYVFRGFRRCGIEPYVIFDGAYDEGKLATFLKRTEERIKTADLMARGRQDKGILPIMTYETYRSVIDKLRVRHVTCDSESDHQAAALAASWNCPLLTKDSDFLVYNLPAGVILLNYFDLSKMDLNRYRHLRVKIYRIDDFLRQVGQRDANIMALFASMLGNDYFDSDRLKRFFEAGGLPDRCNGLNYRGCERAVSLLGWLQGRRLNETTLDEVASFCPEDGAALKRDLWRSIRAYTDLTSQFEGYFDRGGAAACARSSIIRSFGGRPLPSWFTTGVRSGAIPVHALDAITLRRVILPQQVSVMSEPSPYECSLSLRRFFYSVLLTFDEDDRRSDEEFSIIEHDRGLKLELTCDQVLPMVSLENGTGVPRLDAIPELDVDVRSRLLLDVLGVSPDSVSRFPPNGPSRLTIATIVFWMRNARPPISSDRLRLDALLVCLVKCGMFADDIGTPAAAARSSDALESLERSSDDGGAFDCWIVHTYAQYQCCLQVSIYIHQMLLLPPFDFHPSTAFNGTFSYNLCGRLQRERDPDRYLQSRVLVDATIFQRFSEIRKLIVSIVDDDGSD